MGALARNGLTVTNSLLHGQLFRSSHPEVFLGKDILKICHKFADKTHAEVRFKKKLQSNLITLRHECSLNLQHIFRTPFPMHTSGRLILILSLCRTLCRTLIVSLYYLQFLLFLKRCSIFISRSSILFRHDFSLRVLSGIFDRKHLNLFLKTFLHPWTLKSMPVS